MPNILKRFSRARVEPFPFPEAVALEALEDASPAPADGQASADGAESPEDAAPCGPGEPIRYALLQADTILQDARREAEVLLAQAREEAERQAEDIRKAAMAEGRQDGYAQGMAQALEEAARQRVAMVGELGGEVQQFLEAAGAALERQLDQNVNEMRDLALAVAEKVMCVSLKSSAEVITRMIQTAIDKRKRREWVHIYVAECDSKRMGQIPVSLTAALAAISDRVRIIPIAGDESGSCLIEMPDEIIDASVATQISNLRGLLMDAPNAGGVGNRF